MPSDDRLLRELPAVTVSYIGAALCDERVTIAALGGALLVANGLVIAVAALDAAPPSAIETGIRHGGRNAPLP